MANVSLSYDDNGHSGSPAYVFVHGWTCDRTFFKPQYDYFGANARAIALDLRGHGKSPLAHDGDYSVESFAGDVAALIDDLGIGPAIVVGHSLGGVVTCALAAARPDLVSVAVMVDPAPLIIADEIRAVIDGLVASMEGEEADAARLSLVEGMFMASDDAGRKADIIATMRALPNDVAAAAIGGLFHFDGQTALSAVQCPIASIGSDGPTNDAAALKAVNPKVMIGQTLGAGHFNQLEVPDQVNAMIERFVSINLST